MTTTYLGSDDETPGNGVDPLSGADADSTGSNPLEDSGFDLSILDLPNDTETSGSIDSLADPTAGLIQDPDLSPGIVLDPSSQPSDAHHSNPRRSLAERLESSLEGASNYTIGVIKGAYAGSKAMSRGAFKHTSGAVKGTYTGSKATVGFLKTHPYTRNALGIVAGTLAAAGGILYAYDRSDSARVVYDGDIAGKHVVFSDGLGVISDRNEVTVPFSQGSYTLIDSSGEKSFERSKSFSDYLKTAELEQVVVDYKDGTKVKYDRENINTDPKTKEVFENNDSLYRVLGTFILNGETRAYNNASDQFLTEVRNFTDKVDSINNYRPSSASEQPNFVGRRQ